MYNLFLVHKERLHLHFNKYALGIMYYNAEGCEKNLEKSFAHFMV